ncbi:MAG TPA: cytochrome c, partial [Bacteroidales bacterium]|nr:cytochrome c [Bacteroidales bacterium]
FAGCDRNRNNPGWDYFPDMFYSKAYETYDPNPNFADSSTMRVPVEGTIPRDFTPFGYSKDPDDRIRAGEELHSPLVADLEVLERGKHEFTTFCSGCHGDKGDGNGYLHSSGLYIVVPRSLISETAINLKDGEIYHTITLGFGSMGAHGSQIRPEDRWNIIAYIRHVLQAGEHNDTTGTGSAGVAGQNQN